MEIKTRDADYCNLKFFLMFLVVYGHLIEGRIEESDLLMHLYKLIYTVHMPLFLFLSGFFMKGKKQCFHQMRQMLLCYGVCQTGVVIFGNGFFGQSLSFFTPVWHLWYLLSLGCMAAAGYGWYWLKECFPWMDRKMVKLEVLAATVFFACAAGGWGGIGRAFSLSRTIVFLPCFLGGLFCPADFDWKRYRRFGIAAIGLFILLYCVAGRKILVSFFYQADDYGAISFARGVNYRLICYLLAGSMGVFLLTFFPGRRLWFSKMGTDTFAVYLLHAPLVKMFQKAEMPGAVFIAASPFFAFYIMFILYKIFAWQRQMYAVRLAGRRNGGF